MTDSDNIRHRIAIAGRVTDQQTEMPLAGARVTITGAPQRFNDWLQLKALRYGAGWEKLATRPDQALAGSDGTFYFLDLPFPKGSYKLSVFLPIAGSRYGDASVEAKIAPVKKGNLKPILVDVALPPTTIRGAVTGIKTGEPVVMAEIRLKGSSEHAFSDSRGEFLLTAVEAGVRTVEIFARGFKPVSNKVTLKSAGNVATVDIALDK